MKLVWILQSGTLAKPLQLNDDCQWITESGPDKKVKSQNVHVDMLLGCTTWFSHTVSHPLQIKYWGSSVPPENKSVELFGPTNTWLLWIQLHKRVSFWTMPLSANIYTGMRNVGVTVLKSLLRTWLSQFHEGCW